jgi:hypothetical protein
MSEITFFVTLVLIDFSLNIELSHFRCCSVKNKKQGDLLHHGASYSLECKYFSVKIKSFNIGFNE